MCVVCECIFVCESVRVCVCVVQVCAHLCCVCMNNCACSRLYVCMFVRAPQGMRMWEIGIDEQELMCASGTAV